MNFNWIHESHLKWSRPKALCQRHFGRSAIYATSVNYKLKCFDQIRMQTIAKHQTRGKIEKCMEEGVNEDVEVRVHSTSPASVIRRSVDGRRAPIQHWCLSHSHSVWTTTAEVCIRYTLVSKKNGEMVLADSVFACNLLMMNVRALKPNCARAAISETSYGRMDEANEMNE